MSSFLQSLREPWQAIGQVWQLRFFRHYQLGLFASTNALWMMRLAVGWLAWQQQQSSFWLAIVIATELVSSLATSVWGGVLADKITNAGLMLAGQLALMSICLLLAILQGLDLLSPVALLLLMFAFGAVSGLVMPARLSMVSHLLPKTKLAAGIALNSTSFNLSRFTGPALAAALLSQVELFWVFLLCVLLHSLLVWPLKPLMTLPSQLIKLPSTASAGIWPVFGYLKQSPFVLMLIGLQLIQGFMLRPATELLAAFTDQQLGLGVDGLAWLNAFFGVGAIVGALLFSHYQSSEQASKRLLWFYLLACASLLAFVYSPNLMLACATLALQSLAMSSLGIMAMALVQNNLSSEFLGRVLSLYSVIFRAAPALGTLLYGWIADGIGLAHTGLMFVGLSLLTLFWLKALPVRAQQSVQLAQATR